MREALEEAADIARKGEWGQVAEGWTTKAHLFGVDLFRPEHPVVQCLAAEVDQRNALIGPSWRGIADEPVCEAWPLGHRQQEWVVVADLEQIVAFEMRPDGLCSMPVAAATADINDPAAISQIAADLAVSGDQLGGRPSVSTRREWNWRADPDDMESNYPDYICDVPTGQWRRPEGMSPLPDTPDDYPALSYGGLVSVNHRGPRLVTHATGLLNVSVVTLDGSAPNTMRNRQLWSVPPRRVRYAGLAYLSIARPRSRSHRTCEARTTTPSHSPPPSTEGC